MSYGPKKTLPLGFVPKMEGLQWDPANRTMKNLNFIFFIFLPSTILYFHCL